MARNSVLALLAIGVIGAALLLLGVALWMVSLPDVVTIEKATVTVYQVVDQERHSREVALWMAGGATVLVGLAGVVAAIIASEIHE